MTTSDQERAAPAQQPVALDWPHVVQLGWCLGLFASVIKSGEPWSDTCQNEYDKANLAIKEVFKELASEPEPRAEIVRLTRERDEARGIVRDIHWMAVRYADNRKSYAVGMCNDALRKAYDGGWLVYKGDKRHALDPQYARHGLFDAEWRSAVDAATGRAEAAESRAEALSAEAGAARAAAFEEAAQIADSFGRWSGFSDPQGDAERNALTTQISRAIRARAFRDATSEGDAG